jgi:membrane protease YdiL (CAAX protease family)
MDQLVSILALASLTTLAWLASKRVAGQPLLPYEPRRPVPWNFVIVALAIAPALLSIAGEAVGSSHAKAPNSTAEGEITAVLTVDDLWQFAAQLILLAVACYVVLAAVFRADGRDLGLPQSAAQLARDVRAGALACLAALVPVFAIQYLLVTLLQVTDQHPILEELKTDRSAAMMLAAGLSAVIGAPLFEETAFRLIFQGWLEKHESPPPSVEHQGDEELKIASFAQLPPADHVTEFESIGAADAPPRETPSESTTIRFAVYDPDRPCNWAPIIVSSAIFAVAHIGQGVAPFSLFPLALVLGYLYQRTHRIVPSIVCHAMFNATSLLALWLSDPQQFPPTFPGN